MVSVWLLLISAKQSAAAKTYEDGNDSGRLQGVYWIWVRQLINYRFQHCITFKKQKCYGKDIIKYYTLQDFFSSAQACTYIGLVV